MSPKGSPRAFRPRFLGVFAMRGGSPFASGHARCQGRVLRRRPFGSRRFSRGVTRATQRSYRLGRRRSQCLDCQRRARPQRRRRAGGAWIGRRLDSDGRWLGTPRGLEPRTSRSSVEHPSGRVGGLPGGRFAAGALGLSGTRRPGPRRDASTRCASPSQPAPKRRTLGQPLISGNSPAWRQFLARTRPLRATNKGRSAALRPPASCFVALTARTRRSQPRLAC